MVNESEHRDALIAATKRKASLGQTVRAVFWSFFGVRKGKDHAADIERLNPVHVIIVGIIAAALFVATLITIVSFVLHK